MIKPIHILLVEDNEGDILLTTDALEEGDSNYEVSIVKDGWEAIQFVQKNGVYKNTNTPDLILLDINLPKMNGHEVLKKVKSNPQLRHIPIIILTTSSSESDILSAYQNYANSYITKPVEMSDFLEAIASMKFFWTTLVKLPTQHNP